MFANENDATKNFCQFPDHFPETLPSRADYAILDRLVNHYNLDLTWVLATEWNYALDYKTLTDGDERFGYEIVHLESDTLNWRIYGKPAREEAMFGLTYLLWGETDEDEFVKFAIIDNQWDGGQISMFVYTTITHGDVETQENALRNMMNASSQYTESVLEE